MDPLTLFALANGAVSAVKAGCKLYKDIKSAAGDVKGVLKDLDEQFNKAHPPGKPASLEARKQFAEEKTRVVELNKRANSEEHTGVYQEIGNQLGAYYDNMYKCLAVFEEEERRSKNEIYKGDDSLGKRALQRVLMKKQLQQMGTELREVMTYQSPPELGALYTEVNEMMEVLSKEQKILITKQMQNEERELNRKKARNKKLRQDIILGLIILFTSCSLGLMFAFIVQDRIQKYPQYGTSWIPRTEEERRYDNQPKVYIGR